MRVTAAGCEPRVQAAGLELDELPAQVVDGALKVWLRCRSWGLCRSSIAVEQKAGLAVELWC